MHATVEEFIEALGRMTKDERLGLLAVARMYARRRGPFTCGKDLLSEAIYRVAEGDRHWPLETPLQRFLMGAMRSILNTSNQRAENKPGQWSVDEAERAQAGGELLAPSAEELAMDAQRRAAGRAAIEYTRGKLRGDRVALRVLEDMRMDRRASETRAAHGMGRAEYHAARERVRSHLRQFRSGNPQ